MIDLWKQDTLADFIYFQPKMSSSDIGYANTEDDDDISYHVPCGNEDIKNNLLLIHMTVVQKLLLQCYNNLVLMDATYRTCRLMPPFFFLPVKTNVNYSPVTSFIVQNEDAKSISEALSMIKQYISLDRIDIKNFMINCFLIVGFIEINVGEDGSKQHGMALVSIMSFLCLLLKKNG